MSRRSQSDVIGVVLLTAVIGVTVTSVGGVALIELQKDIGNQPVADIESDLTLSKVELEHFGGDELNASETVVLIDGDTIVLPLTEFDGVDDEFEGGMRIENDEFDTVAGEISVRVVHEPSQSVLHSDSHRLEYLFFIEGETDDVFMLKEPPIDYTASESAELTVSDESVIDLDKEAQEITGVLTGESTAITVRDAGGVQTIDLTVLGPDELTIETDDVTAVGGGLRLEGELKELSELDETDLYVRYRRQRPVEFNGTPDDNDDDIIAHGEFHTGPDGYGHNNEWVHDNNPLVPGLNKTYEYSAVQTPAGLGGDLRAGIETSDTTGVDFSETIPESESFDLITNDVPADDPFEVTVEYTADGEAVNVYVEDSLEYTWDVSGSTYDELYFSSFEAARTANGAGSLRLIDAQGPGEPQYERIESGVESQNYGYSGTLSGLQPGTNYYVEAYVEQDVGGNLISATGDTLANSTDP